MNRILSILLSAAMLMMLASCGSSAKDDSSESSSAPEVSSSEAADNSSASSEEETKDAAAVQEPEEKPDEPEQEPAAAAYDFSQPAPETEPVTNDYFKDAAFVGDSRTDGFLIYSGIGCGENLTSNGLSIFKLAEKKALTIDGQQYTLLEALKLKQYSKVYLSLGVNELGMYNDNGFYQSYCDAIDAIREAQPNAVIYIQGLIPVNEQRVAETTKRSYLENNHLRVYNDLMRQAAQEHHAVYLDLYSAFVNADGVLPYDASKDGVHLNSDYCKKWLSYLQTHTVDFDSFLAGQTQA